MVSVSIDTAPGLVKFPASVPSKAELKEAQVNWLTSKDAQTKFGQLIDCLARNVEVSKKVMTGEITIRVGGCNQSVFELVYMLVKDPKEGEQFASSHETYKSFVDGL